MFISAKFTKTTASLPQEKKSAWLMDFSNQRPCLQFCWWGARIELRSW